MYFSPNIISDHIKEELGRARGMYERIEMHIGFWQGKMKETTVRLQHRQLYNTKMNLTEIGWEGADWINWPQGRYKWQDLIHSNEHSNSIKTVNFLAS